MERQNTAWERIFARHLSDKGFVSKINLRNIKLNNQSVENGKRSEQIHH